MLYTLLQLIRLHADPITQIFPYLLGLTLAVVTLYYRIVLGAPAGAGPRLPASTRCGSRRSTTSLRTPVSSADRPRSAAAGIGQRDFPRCRCRAARAGRRMPALAIEGRTMTARPRQVLLILVQSALQAAQGGRHPATQSAK